MAKRGATFRRRRLAAGILCAAVAAGLLAGCGGQKPKETEGNAEAGTTAEAGTAAETERTVVTALYDKELTNLGELVKARYPQIDLQVEKTPYPSEQQRRLEKGAGPDLIVENEPAPEDAEIYLADISDMAASTAYEGTVMKSVKQEGKIYLLPLPGMYTGYIVNETLFEQAGIPLPTSNQELVEALARMKEQGIGIGEDGTNFSVISHFNTNLGLFYVGCMVPDFLGTVDGVQWLAGFWDQKTTFKGVWEKSFALSDAMTEAGVMDPMAAGRQKNLIRYHDRMVDGTQAVIFGGSDFYYECTAANEEAAKAGTAKAYSYRMLPILSWEGNEPWLLYSPLAYIGINRAASEEKQEACRKILDLLSTPEGQEAVMKDLGMGVSFLQGYEPDENHIPKGAEETVKAGYVYHVQFPGKIVEYLGSKARSVLGGKSTAEEILEAVDKYYYEGSEAVDYDLSKVGMVAQDLVFLDYNVRKVETAIGNFIADCVAEASGAPIAVVNGGAIRGSFYQGEIYGEDLAAVCPYNNTIVVLEMDGRTIWDMLENGVSACTDELPGGRFLQISGLKYVFDSSRPAGSRIVEVTLPDGTALDVKASYQVAVNDYMAGSQGYAEGNGDEYFMLNCYDEASPKGAVVIVKETGLTYWDALRRYFEDHKDTAAEARLEGRITDLAGDK